MYIVEFSIDGLAGRTEAYSAKLNRDVNVFFGLNGSGKTTLLKILQSALSADTEILKDLPFTHARVKVYLNKYKSFFLRSITQKPFEPPTDVISRSPNIQSNLWTDLALNSAFSRTQKDLFGVTTELVNSLQNVMNWSSDPAEPSGIRLTRNLSGFLPISRLYRNVTTSTGKRLSEQELDSAFARGLRAQWAEYYADISQEIAKVQERGLANILGFFLGGQEDQNEVSDVPNQVEAYARIRGFLERQPNLSHVLRSEKEFAALYARKPELQTVVKQIEKIETAIDEISAPRERFRNVLESMFTGSKHLVFTEKEIRVELPRQREIGLSLLSSGEKQLLVIALSVLVGGNHTLIIDEPELSMHVDWQTKLVSTLQDLNPRIQLIMATHSPEITADLPDEKIFRI